MKNKWKADNDTPKPTIAHDSAIPSLRCRLTDDRALHRACAIRISVQSWGRPACCTTMHTQPANFDALYKYELVGWTWLLIVASTVRVMFPLDG